jgi:hypothetical protein
MKIEEAIKIVRVVSESVRLNKREQDKLQEALKLVEELAKKNDVEKKQ